MFGYFIRKCTAQTNYFQLVKTNNHHQFESGPLKGKILTGYQIKVAITLTTLKETLINNFPFHTVTLSTNNQTNVIKAVSLTSLLATLPTIQWKG